MSDEKQEIEISSWLEKVAVPNIVEKLGRHGCSFKSEIQTHSNKDTFVSRLFFVELTFFSAGKEAPEMMKFVVKVPQNVAGKQAFFRSACHFRNEILFYERLGKNCTDYPKCVLAIREPIERALVVLEDVTCLGYAALRWGQSLTMEQVLTAVREIGRFHGRGYVLKENNPEEFFELTRGFREVIYDDSAHPAMLEIVNGLSQRPVDYLRSVVKFDPEFCDKISVPLSSAHEKILRDCVEPRNELAVLCHGDFTSTNILFRQGDAGGLEGMLIDFAQLRYASPATDLSVFFYLSCDLEIRKNFLTVFKAYHDSVLEYLRVAGIRELGKYSFAKFLKEYKRHAVFGYEIAIYFKPFVWLNFELDFDDLVENPSKYIGVLYASGGDELSKELSGMLLELRDNGCLEHLI